MKPFHVSLSFSLFVLGVLACKTAPKSSTTRPDASRTSIDWAGTYRGTTPCADCEGIETVVTLNDDRTYSVKRRYLGKETDFRTSQGTFAWNDEGSKITLRDDGGTVFLVGENRLFQLDKSGQRITGNLADRYVLTKNQDASGLTERYWKLTEL